jgi:pimeloyl-ACP methyl ester carboxylesterase
VTINTHSVLNVSTPIYDARTGEYTSSLVTDDAPLHVHVDAGYTATGLVKIITNYTDGPDYSTFVMPQVTAQVLTGDNLANLNTYTYELTGTLAPDFTGASPMGFVGSTANGDITAGVLMDESDTTQASASKISPTSPVSASRSAVNPSARAALQDAIARAQRGEEVPTAFAGIAVRLRSAGVGRLVMEDDISQLGDDAAARPGNAGVRLPDVLRPISSTATRSRTFEHKSVGWVLAEDRAVIKQVHSDYTSTMEHVTTWSNTLVTRNRRRDAERHRARPTTARIPLPGEAGSSPSVAPATYGAATRSIAPQASGLQGPSYFVACDDQCSGGGGGTSYPTAIGANPECSLNVTAHINPTGNVNILYQHGFWSNGMTWCAGSYYQRMHFTVGNELRFTTSSGQLYEVQASQLGDSLTKYAPTFPGPYVLIGHSNGGLVSRYAAQNFNGDASLIRGVMSVGSPHGGAPLAKLRTEQVAAAVAIPTAAYIGCSFIPSISCTSLALLAGYGVGSIAGILAPILVQSNNPILEEMAPGAAFQSYINGRGNPTLVAGIRNTAWDRWTPMRLYGDKSHCGNSVIDCGDAGGRSFVHSTDIAYHTAVKCAIVGGILGIFWSPAASTAFTCGSIAAGMRAIDNQYHAISVGNAHGDGIVPEWSQYFPGAASNAQYWADDSDSHLGETSSGRYTGIKMKQALNEVFSVPITNP